MAVGVKTGVIIGIGIGVLAVGVILAWQNSPALAARGVGSIDNIEDGEQVKDEQDSQSVLVTDSAVIPGATKDKTLVAVFTDCKSEIRTDIDNYPLKVKCYNDEGIATERFSFNVPAKLDGKIALAADTTLYQYGENDYEVALKDDVGEKRYAVTVWEQPK